MYQSVESIQNEISDDPLDSKNLTNCKTVTNRILSH